MSRVYIGRLSYRAREKDVERFFKGYGKILEVDLKNGYGTERAGDERMKAAAQAAFKLTGYIVSTNQTCLPAICCSQLRVHDSFPVIV